MGTTNTKGTNGLAGLEGDAVLLIGGVLVVGAAGYFGYKWWQQHQKNAGEKELDSPAGIIAGQLKVVFNKYPVDDIEYKKAASQITAENKDDVYRIYKEITGRNLSDDVANSVTTKSQATAERQAKINTTVSSLVKIENDQIKFQVQKGSVVRFEAGSKVAIPLYQSPEGVLPEGMFRKKIEPYFSLQPNAFQYLVNDIREIPIEGIALAAGWTKFFKPIVHTRSVFTAVQIVLPTKSPTGVKGAVLLWGDALAFRAGKGTAHLKGLGEVANQLI